MNFQLVCIFFVFSFFSSFFFFFSFFFLFLLFSSRQPSRDVELTVSRDQAVTEQIEAARYSKSEHRPGDGSEESSMHVEEVSLALRQNLGMSCLEAEVIVGRPVFIV